MQPARLEPSAAAATHVALSAASRSCFRLAKGISTLRRGPNAAVLADGPDTRAMTHPELVSPDGAGSHSQRATATSTIEAQPAQDLRHHATVGLVVAADFGHERVL